jgi:tetratricopeptide (TPR) repeat protein
MRLLSFAVVLWLAASDPATRALVESGHYKQARKILEARVAASPQDAEAAALLARVRLELNELDAALPLAETAVKLEPNTAGFHSLLAEAVGRIAQRASVFKQIGLAKRFRQEAETAIRLDPKNIDGRELMLAFYLNAPSMFGGDKKKADAMAEEIGRVDPAAGFLARGTIIVDTKGTGDLESLYKQAVAAATTPEMKYRATSELMNVYAAPKTQRLDAAEQEARALIALDPARVSGYIGLAIVYATGGRMADLDRTLGEGERAVPDNLAPYYQAGRVLLTRNTELPRAETYLRKYLTVEPEGGSATWAHAHWRLGLVLEKEGRRADAVAELEQAVRLKPDLDDARKDLKRLR